ncbi:dual 3',5'-cyclic-AMP and -GMP phosphodiesterase 11A-like [Ptychodera flava]|uniref:dual 3',5'-cyclic-AMP and -GMP phosphodiesterase 11A-like n=1 Tax=Ptychodera flava TaxID=63121 RepID=UPI00396A4E58
MASTPSEQIKKWLESHPSFVERWMDDNPSVVGKWILKNPEKMSGVLESRHEILENLLDANPQIMEKYSQRRRNKVSIQRSATAYSRSDDRDRKRKDSKNNGDATSSNDGTPTTPRKRSQSKQFLRQDFARSKARSYLHASEPTMQSDSLERGLSKRYPLRRASSLPPGPIHSLSILLESRVRIPQHTTLDRERKLELKSKNEREFFLELVKDISHDLHLKRLISRILTNVSLLVDAEQSCLFLIEGPKGKEVLVSHTPGSNSDSPISFSRGGKESDREDNAAVQVPMGYGIVGRVAESGKQVNIPNTDKDPLYEEEFHPCGVYQVKSLLCMPIRNSEDDVIGVVEVVNKHPDGTAFNRDDEKLLETYLTFCGIGITNAQVFRNYMREYDRNRALLEVVHDVFEEQTSLENVVQKVMQRAQSLLKCERCSVILLKDPTEMEVTFSKMFEMTTSVNGHSSTTYSTGEVKFINGVMQHVAETGDTLNIHDAENDPRFDPDLDQASGFRTRSILCMPIRDNKIRIIGVAQIVNRTDGHPFDENDEQLFEAFTIFCGLGINNTIMYNEMCKAVAKQKVALEVVSYHACSTQYDVEKLEKTTVPESSLAKIHSMDFDDFELDPDGMLKASLGIFTDSGMIEKFNINYETMCRFLLTVRKNYRNVSYHNFRHAFNVQQVMFAILQGTCMKEILTDVEQLALLVGSICHDLDHRGTNNAFQLKSHSSLSQLYGAKATMEYHHFNHAVMILNSQDHNIFATLTSEQYTQVMKLLKHAILATDLAQYFKLRNTFTTLTESSQYNWELKEHRDTLRAMLMTACDVGAITKPWEIQKHVVELVTKEFFAQGDKERKELNIEPHVMFDRSRKDELPQMQVSFIDTVCIPLYQALQKIDSKLNVMYEGVKANRLKWSSLITRRKSAGDASRGTSASDGLHAGEATKTNRLRKSSKNI